jgi:hypothetical protein
MRQIRKTTLMLVAVLALAAMSFVSAQDGSLKPGDSVQGTLSNSTDSYTFTATAGTFYVITLESEDFDTKVTVTDGAGGEWSDDDGGDGTNSRLNFLAPAGGDFTISAGGWTGDDTGTYVLTLTAAEISEIAYDAPSVIALAGSDAHLFTFMGNERDVVTITADSGGAMDTRLTLTDPSGVEIASDDDGGAGSDPAIVRMILPSMGAYLVELSPFADQELQGSLSLTVATTDLLSLDNGSITVSLGEEFDYDVLRFTAEAGTAYNLTVEATGDSANVRLEIDDESGFAFTSIDLSNAIRGTLTFRASESGLTDIKIREGFITTDNEVIVTIKPVE